MTEEQMLRIDGVPEDTTRIVIKFMGGIPKDDNLLLGMVLFPEDLESAPPKDWKDRLEQLEKYEKHKQLGDFLAKLIMAKEREKK